MTNEKNTNVNLATFAIIAIVARISTIGSLQVVQATNKLGHEFGQPERGTPYGQALSPAAQDGGFGQDIEDCREENCPGFNEAEGNNGIGDARASEEAGKSPGKAVPPPTRDEVAGNPAN
jgi:hypothetical protein